MDLVLTPNSMILISAPALPSAKTTLTVARTQQQQQCWRVLNHVGHLVLESCPASQELWRHRTFWCRRPRQHREQSEWLHQHLLSLLRALVCDPLEAMQALCESSSLSRRGALLRHSEPPPEPLPLLEVRLGKNPELQLPCRQLNVPLLRCFLNLIIRSWRCCPELLRPRSRPLLRWLCLEERLTASSFIRQRSLRHLGQPVGEDMVALAALELSRGRSL